MSFTLFGPTFRFHELFVAQSVQLGEVAKLLREAVLHFPQIAEPCRQVHDISSQSEKIYHDIVQELSMTSIRPLDREDVHDLKVAFAFCFKAMKSIASRLGLFGLRTVAPSVGELTENLVEMTTQVRRILEVLNRGERIDLLSATVVEIREEFDRFLLVGLGELYESRPSNGEEIMEIIKWSQLYDRLEEAMDGIQGVATILEAIVLKTL